MLIYFLPQQHQWRVYKLCSQQMQPTPSSYLFSFSAHSGNGRIVKIWKTNFSEDVIKIKQTFGNTSVNLFSSVLIADADAADAYFTDHKLPIILSSL